MNKCRSELCSVENCFVANVVRMSVTSVNTVFQYSPGAKIFDTVIDAVIVHVLEDKQVVVAHKVMDTPGTEDGFVGMV